MPPETNIAVRVDASRRDLRVVSAPAVAWMRRLAVGGLIAVLALALLLALRRLSGAFTAPAPAILMTLTAIGTAGIVFAGRSAWRWTLASQPIGRDAAIVRLIGSVGTISLWLLAFGCSYPASRIVDWVVWLPLLAGDQFLRQSFIHRPVRGRRLRLGAVRPEPQAAEPREEPPVEGSSPDEDTSASEDFSAVIDEQTLQHVTRVRNGSGVESIRGTLRAEFSAGQRHATLHVGFCPPLSHQPMVDAEPGEGPEATVKIVQALAHGARLEVRLSEPAEEACSVLVEISAIPSIPSENGTRMNADLADVRG